ncbi:MAG: hypothetical protein Q8L79_05675 [Methylobacter sp.]|uniref:hypothetical protein n=1 Tax=Methylobacter sp. TaxID=2051955 RepID=UPI002730C1D2|nr:hypothetical protein [Methylobacter sp.]MDP1664600.1 hypothetical protein [Methylobacter sp.]
MNKQGIENLKRIAQGILDPEKNLADLSPRISDLRVFLEKRTILKLESEVNLGEGQSCSIAARRFRPWWAALCAPREVFRSAAFIKGAGSSAGCVARRSSGTSPVAGCGSFAPCGGIFSAAGGVYADRYSPGILALRATFTRKAGFRCRSNQLIRACRTVGTIQD